QFPNKTLLLAVYAACIGGTFQYGYNISIINADVFMNETWFHRYNNMSEELLTLLWSSIVSIFTLGGFIGASIGGALAIRLGRELLGGEQNWPILLSTSCIAAILQLLVFPWFLLSQTKCVVVEQWCLRSELLNIALKKLHGPDDCHAEREDMGKERITALGTQTKTMYSYATYIFTQAEIPEPRIPYVTIGTGACECVTSFTSGILVESLGRRVLIIGGYSLMTLCCVCLTVTLSFQDASPWVPYLSIVCVFCFILSFGLGPGGVTTILTTELFTQTARPAAYMIGGSVNWLSFFLIGMIFPFIVVCFFALVLFT
ncbi:GTR11 protein, partial [Amia calva]|nr:GTR11 protein [Amia calva]